MLSPLRLKADLTAMSEWRSTILFYLLADPLLQLFPVHWRQLGEIWPQPNRVADVYVLNLALWQVRVPMHEDSNAMSQPARHRNFVPAQERHVDPAQLTRRKRRKLRVQIGGRAEDCAGHIALVDVITANH